MVSPTPGRTAVTAGMKAAERWAVEHPVVAQLLFWRPVPGYEPSPKTFAPTLEIVAALRSAAAGASGAGEIHPNTGL
jgi:hypothetical protein